ncbi:MAG: tape measure protein [Eubacterium sp.]|nr:tape measure protein [Eubacterium sp.]
MDMINSAIAVQENFTNVVSNVYNTVNLTVTAINNIQSTINNTSFTNIHQEINQAAAEMQELEETAEESADAAEKLSSPFENLGNKIKDLASNYLSLEKLQQAMDLSDEFVRTTAKIDAMNQSFNTANNTAKQTDDIVKMIHQSAQDTGIPFNDMAAAVTNFGTNAQNAFGNQEEAVAFADLVQKQMNIAGNSAQESSGAMMQLSQAMGTGALSGSDLNSMLQQAPNLVQTIADYMNVPISKIQEMADSGALTADIVKNAMFSSADEINAKFESTPKTFEQIMTSIQNNALMAFQPILMKLNEIVNSDFFQSFIDGFIGGIQTVGEIAANVFDFLMQIGGFIADNWSVIAPIILGIVAAIAAYEIIANAASIATKVWSGIQAIFNAIMNMNPVGLVVMGIIILIAVIYAVIGWINKATGETLSATGVILGAIMWLGALIINIVIGLINSIIQYLWACFVEPFIGIVEWILTAANGGFNSFGGAVANLIGHIISWFLSLGKIVTTVIDAIFGTDWTSGLSSLQDKVTSWGTNENAVKIKLETPQIKRIDMKDAYNVGYNFGTKIDDKVSGFFKKDGGFDLSNILGGGLDTNNLLGNGLNTSNVLNGGSSGGNSFGNYDTGQIPANIASTAQNTEKAADTMEITSEDLKYLRDIAETEAVNRFTTAEIRVEMNNNNTISSDMDLDGIVDYLAVGVNNAMEKAAEGVHI